MSEYILRSFGLTKKYKDFIAVNNLSMNVKKGNIYGFIGKNGAGKSTMMKMILGLCTPTKGEIELFGNKSNILIKERKRIGAVIENPAIYNSLTAKENLDYLRILCGITENNTMEILKKVGLEKDANKKSKLFSMGMKQRLSLALALVTSPDLLLLDEPINGLDPQGTVEIRNLLLDLNQNENITIIVSSHILDELSKIATHYGIIDNGMLIEEISAKDLKNKCESYLEVKVDNCEKTSFILENNYKNISYKVEPNNIIKIYDLNIKSSEINSLLNKNDILVDYIKVAEMSLENYFLNISK